MNSSKGWGDSPTDSQLDNQERLRWLRVIIALPVIIIIPILGGWLWGTITEAIQGSPEEFLQSARIELEKALEQPDSIAIEQSLEAEKYLRKALKLDNKNQSTQLLLCAALSLRKNSDLYSENVETEFEEMVYKISLDTCNPDDQLLAAKIFFQVSDRSRAGWLMGNLIEKNIGDRRENLELAIKIEFDDGADESALTLSNELLELSPNNCLSYKVISMIAEERQVPEKMLDAYQDLIKYGCGDPSLTKVKLLKQYLLLGASEEARNIFNDLKIQSPNQLRKNPTIEPSLLLLEGDSELALNLINEVLSQAPDDKTSILLKARILLAKQELKDAITNLEKAITLDPVDTQALYLLGQALARDDQRERSKEILKKQKEVLDIKVELLKLERIAGSNRDDVETRLKIAFLYEKIGWNEKVEYWRNAAKNAGR